MTSLPSQSAVECCENVWLDSSLGQYLQQQEQGLYDQAVVDLFGFNALQFGMLQMDLLQNSRIAHRFKCDSCAQSPLPADLLCADDFLPIADTSLDLLLLPHRLEFSERPHQTLREAERVLMPEGHLLLSGFNRFSLWGLMHLLKNWLAARRGVATFPWNGRFIGLARLKDWLALLGFEVVSVEMVCHVPPIECTRWRSRFAWMDRLSKRCFPLLGGVYFIVAKKRVACMTPLKPHWKKASMNVGLVAQPNQSRQTQRNLSDPGKVSIEVKH